MTNAATTEVAIRIDGSQVWMGSLARRFAAGQECPIDASAASQIWRQNALIKSRRLSKAISSQTPIARIMLLRSIVGFMAIAARV